MKPKIFPDKPIPIRFPKSLRQRIDVVADRDKISWAEAVRRLLERGLQVEERDEPSVEES